MLVALYPRLSLGGYCIIDDWGLDGRCAVSFLVESYVTRYTSHVTRHTSHITLQLGQKSSDSLFLPVRHLRERSSRSCCIVVGEDGAGAIRMPLKHSWVVTLDWCCLWFSKATSNWNLHPELIQQTTKIHKKNLDRPLTSIWRHFFIFVFLVVTCHVSF